MTEHEAVLKHLGFLIDDYKLKYSHIADSNDRYGAETFSFYNDSGCFTLHCLSLLGEWGWFYSDSFSTKQTDLLKNEIDQTEYIKGAVFGYRSMLKKLGKSIHEQIEQSGSFFNISVS